jgi:6-phospho-beta-glucosidase
VNGQDILPDIMDQIVKKGAPKNIPDFDYDPRLLRSLGMIPMFYLRYFYYTEKMLNLLQEKKKTRAEEVMELEEKLLMIYRDETQVEKPDLLNQRGGAYYSLVAVDLIEALCSQEESEHIVNLSNGNSTDALPPDAVIECTARISSAGARPLPVGTVDPKIKGLVQAVKAYEALTIQAALNRDYHAAFWALVTHPLGPTADRAFDILDELIALNRLDDLRP